MELALSMDAIQSRYDFSPWFHKKRGVQVGEGHFLIKCNCESESLLSSILKVFVTHNIRFAAVSLLILCLIFSHNFTQFRKFLQIEYLSLYIVGF